MQTGAAVMACGAALVAMAATGVGSTAPVPAAPQAAVPQFATPRSDSPGARRRPFEHGRHERVSCTACHGSGERHRTVLVRTPQDCASCHHDAQRARSCNGCHSTRSLPPPGTVTVPLALTVGDTVVRRALPFRHDVHVRPGSGVTCRDCHTTPVTLAMSRDCGSCHAPHHRPEATCASCHAPVREGVHRATAHRSCSGAGCHATAVAPAPTLSRTLCLTCHAAQAQHEPGGACAACHAIPAERHRARREGAEGGR